LVDGGRQRILSLGLITPGRSRKLTSGFVAKRHVATISGAYAGPTGSSARVANGPANRGRGLLHCHVRRTGVKRIPYYFHLGCPFNRSWGSASKGGSSKVAPSWADVHVVSAGTAFGLSVQAVCISREPSLKLPKRLRVVGAGMATFHCPAYAQLRLNGYPRLPLSFGCALHSYAGSFRAIA
jgi:hypothetical protein